MAMTSWQHRVALAWTSSAVRVIKESPIPYSIIQATQFFEFLYSIADAATHRTAVRLPPVLIQPVAADDVARAVARIATSAPLNGTREIGGPEPFYLDGFDQWLSRTAPDENRHAELGRAAANERVPLNENAFRVSEVPPGSVLLLFDVAVFNVEGGFCATQARCTHRQGPLSEGVINGSTVTCPLHGAQFDVWTGLVLRGPAKDPLKTYTVTVDGDAGCVVVPLAPAVQGV
jgi:nitrite reductase/ring-hydroxylating ferredoxin subunit